MYVSIDRLVTFVSFCRNWYKCVRNLCKRNCVMQAIENVIIIMKLANMNSIR